MPDDAPLPPASDPPPYPYTALWRYTGVSGEEEE